MLKKGSLVVMILLDAFLLICLVAGRNTVPLTFGKSRKTSQRDVVIGTVLGEQVHTDRMHHPSRKGKIDF